MQDNHVVERDPSTKLNGGDSEEFTATLVYSDGSIEGIEDVTRDATWELSDPTVGLLCWVTFCPGGVFAYPPFRFYRVFAAENVGKTTLTASYHGLSDNIELTVENPGKAFIPYFLGELPPDNLSTGTLSPENENIITIVPISENYAIITWGPENENIKIVPSENYSTIRLENIKSTVRIDPVLIGPGNFITVGDIRMEPAWSGEPLTMKMIPRVIANTPMKIEFEEGDVTEIGVNATESTENVVITLQQAVAKPTDIQISAPDHIYRYLHLATNVGPDIDSVSFGFRVEKSWLHTNDIGELTVTLNRFSGGEWEPLPTEKVDEDPTYVYYSAESPGLSVFAITGREEVPPSGPVSWALMAGLVVVIAIIGIVVLYRRMH
jgi:PGF-pre-PGF domain-containing protein